MEGDHAVTNDNHHLENILMEPSDQEEFDESMREVALIEDPKQRVIAGMCEMLRKHYILLVRANERITDEKAKETITRVMWEELCVLKGGPSAVEYVMKPTNEAM
jgi:hypothetical protein